MIARKFFWEFGMKHVVLGTGGWKLPTWKGWIDSGQIRDKAVHHRKRASSNERLLSAVRFGRLFIPRQRSGHPVSIYLIQSQSHHPSPGTTIEAIFREFILQSLPPLASPRCCGLSQVLLGIYSSATGA